MAKKKIITKRVQEAIAAGVPEAQALKDEELNAVAANASDGVQEGAGAEEGVKPKIEEGSADDPNTDTGTDAGTGAEAPTPDAVTLLLTEQLREAQQQIVDLRVELGGVQNQIEKTKATHDDLRAIAIEATQRMQVALGGVPLAMDTLDASVVVTQYQATFKGFASRFKVGATATVPLERPNEDGESTTQPLNAAKLAAVKTGKRG